jgi:peptide-methionine (S)-S-oxide reductase
MTDIATFAAGCFWGVEETFLQTPGVLSTEVGYSGGTVENPTYEQVCYSATGHAEAVRVTFDPEKISYEKLLEIFFANHDPTTKNRQGPDIGDQYRSVIFFHSPEQESAARACIERLTSAKKYKRPIVTQIVPAAPFYRAEEYHQQYLRKSGRSSCHI